jgi:acid phosphatase type 7
MRPDTRLSLALACGVAVVAASSPASGDRPAAVRLTKGPYLTELSESGVAVRFELDAPSAASVDVRSDGADAGIARAFEDRAALPWHVVHAADLAPGARYAYVVRAGGKAIGQGTFTTAPRPASGAPTRFLIYGDNRSDAVAHAAVVRSLLATPSDFLVNTGDMVADGARADQWQSFFDIEASLLRDRALFVAIGNHELYDDGAGVSFARYFGFPGPAGAPVSYGTVRWSNVRFFFLNAMHDWSAGPERAWLERALAEADGEPGLSWRIAITHHGPWSSGPHGPSAELVAAHVPELLAAHQVDLVVSGHDHIYERGVAGGMKYVISGGGGAPLYGTVPVASTRKAEAAYHFVEVDVDGAAIHVVARRIDGSVLDRCGFVKNGGWDCDPPAAHASGGEPADDDAATRASAARPMAAPATPPSISRCGCSLPGGKTPLGLGALASGAAIAVAGRQRRKRGKRGKRANCARGEPSSTSR